MANGLSRHGSDMNAWPRIVWSDRAGNHYVLSAAPMHNNELRFDFTVVDRDERNPTVDLCSNLTPQTAVEIRNRLNDYLAFMADKAVS